MHVCLHLFALHFKFSVDFSFMFSSIFFLVILSYDNENNNIINNFKEEQHCAKREGKGRHFVYNKQRNYFFFVIFSFEKTSTLILFTLKKVSSA